MDYKKRGETINAKLDRGLRGRKCDNYFTHFSSFDNKFLIGLAVEDKIVATMELDMDEAKSLVDSIDSFFAKCLKEVE